MLYCVQLLVRDQQGCLLAVVSSLCVCVVQVFIPVWFVVFSCTFWDTFLCCLKYIIVKLFYNNIHISVADLDALCGACIAAKLLSCSSTLIELMLALFLLLRLGMLICGHLVRAHRRLLSL